MSFSFYLRQLIVALSGYKRHTVRFACFWVPVPILNDGEIFPRAYWPFPAFLWRDSSTRLFFLCYKSCLPASGANSFYDTWFCESVLGLEHTEGIFCWHTTVCSFDVVQFACLRSVSVELACLQTLFWPAGISFLENEGFFRFYYEDIQSLCLMWIIICSSGQSCCVRNSSLEVLSGKCPCESTTFLRAVWESGCQLGWFDWRDGLSGKGTMSRGQKPGSCGASCSVLDSPTAQG